MHLEIPHLSRLNEPTHMFLLRLPALEVSRRGGVFTQND